MAMSNKDLTQAVKFLNQTTRRQARQIRFLTKKANGEGRRPLIDPSYNVHGWGVPFWLKAILFKFQPAFSPI